MITQSSKQDSKTKDQSTLPAEYLPEAHPTICGWQRDEDGNDQTDCGGTWCLNDGTPAENDMKYCPYCGKIIAWCSYSERANPL